MVGYDAVMPGIARWSEELTIQEKFLLMEINSSRFELGYSKASNAYLQKRCGHIKERCLQNWLKNLESLGYIEIKFVKGQRRIYVTQKQYKKEFTPMELNLMRYKTPREITDKIKKRFTDKYPFWKESRMAAQVIGTISVLSNFYFEPEAYSLTLAEEPITFEFLELLIEVFSYEKLLSIKQKLKEELSEIERVDLYVMTSIINNHSAEIRAFRDLQKRHNNLTFDEVAALYQEKVEANEK